MDPLSAAGVGLAVVSLTGQCFSGAMKALELIASARGLKPEYRYMTLRLRLEQQRCYNWASASGLLAYSDGEENALHESLLGLQRTSIFEVMVEIEVLVTGFIKQKDKYSSLVPDQEVEQQRPQPDDVDLEAHRMGSSMMPALKQLWTNSRQSVAAYLPSRIRWAAMDREKYKRLIDRLKEFNDAFLGLVDINLNRAIYDMTHQTKLSVLQLHNKVEDLNQLMKALMPEEKLDSSKGTGLPTTAARQAPAVQQSFSNNTSFPFGRSIREAQAEDDFKLAGLARFKASTATLLGESSLEGISTRESSTAISTSEETSKKIPRGHIYLDSTTIEREPSRHRSTAMYRRSAIELMPVWIEWKPYKPADSRLQPPSVTSDRIEKLARLLSDPNKPDSLRVPTCLGYFDDGETNSSENRSGSDDENDWPPEWRFGLVFARSEPDDVRSLYDLLTTVSQPSLTRRVTMASAIANSISALHTVNWLHKGLRSSNIVFVVPKTTTIADTPMSTAHIDLASPLLSGFDYARPADIDEQTELPTVRNDHILFRHPDSHGVEEGSGERYVKSFDIYSLGVILIEIALWRPASSFLQTKRNARNLGRNGSHAQLYKNHRDRLLGDESIGEAIEGGAGSKYAAATRRCLEGKSALGLSTDDDETNALVAVKLHQGFTRHVVRCLEEIQI